MDGCLERADRGLELLHPGCQTELLDCSTDDELRLDLVQALERLATVGRAQRRPPARLEAVVNASSPVEVQMSSVAHMPLIAATFWMRQCEFTFFTLFFSNSLALAVLQGRRAGRARPNGSAGIVVFSSEKGFRWEAVHP